jgi:hypothetical protein
MKSGCFVTLVALGLSAFGCKQSSESAMSAASQTEVAEVAACQLTEMQAKLLSNASEFQTLEKVDLKTLPSDERNALQAKRTPQGCASEEIASLSGNFPSVAAKLPEGSSSDGGSAVLALGGDMMGGMPGVVRTEYISVPKAGSRYLAGYNSDGIMILLQRLMQTRPR